MALISSRSRPLAIGAVAIVLFGVALYLLRSHGVESREVAQWLSSVRSHWWAPLAFIGLYALFNTFLLPATVLTLAAGAVWGWMLGGLWVLVASTTGSAVPYLIAYAGGSKIEQMIRRRAGRIHALLEDEGFLTLLLMRLVPIVPYNVLNYAAGLARIRPRDYFAATFIGTIPGIFIFTYLASAITSGLVSPRDAFIRILFAGVLLAALALVSRFFAGKVKARLTS